MYPFVPSAVDFITQDQWDILACLKKILHNFYVVTIGLFGFYYPTISHYKF